MYSNRGTYTTMPSTLLLTTTYLLLFPARGLSFTTTPTTTFTASTTRGAVTPTTLLTASVTPTSRGEQGVSAPRSTTTITAKTTTLKTTALASVGQNSTKPSVNSSLSRVSTEHVTASEASFSARDYNPTEPVITTMATDMSLRFTNANSVPGTIADATEKVVRFSSLPTRSRTTAPQPGNQSTSTQASYLPTRPRATAPQPGNQSTSTQASYLSTRSWTAAPQPGNQSTSTQASYLPTRSRTTAPQPGNQSTSTQASYSAFISQHIRSVTATTRPDQSTLLASTTPGKLNSPQNITRSTTTNISASIAVTVEIKHHLNSSVIIGMIVWMLIIVFVAIGIFVVTKYKNAKKKTRKSDVSLNRVTVIPTLAIDQSDDDQPSKSPAIDHPNRPGGTAEKDNAGQSLIGVSEAYHRERGESCHNDGGTEASEDVYSTVVVKIDGAKSTVHFEKQHTMVDVHL